MDKIINYLLLTIIFVFDPLAIALVVAANFAFEQLNPTQHIIKPPILPSLSTSGLAGAPIKEPLEVYGENKQPPPPQTEAELKDKIEKLINLQNISGTSHRKRKIQHEINKVQSQLDNLPRKGNSPDRDLFLKCFGG